MLLRSWHLIKARKNGMAAYNRVYHLAKYAKSHKYFLKSQSLCQIWKCLDCLKKSQRAFCAWSVFVTTKFELDLVRPYEDDKTCICESSETVMTQKMSWSSKHDQITSMHSPKYTYLTVAKKTWMLVLPLTDEHLALHRLRISPPPPSIKTKNKTDLLWSAPFIHAVLNTTLFLFNTAHMLHIKHYTGLSLFRARNRKFHSATYSHAHVKYLLKTDKTGINEFLYFLSDCQQI